MEKIGEIEVTVEAVPLWDNQHALLGYFAALLGPTWNGRTRTYYRPAIKLAGVLQEPTLYPSAGEALTAWQDARPCTFAASAAERYAIHPKVVEEINARQLYREAK